MERQIFFLVNPRAAKGRAAVWWQQTEPFLADLHYPYEVGYTTGAYTAPAIVRAAIERGANLIVAIGGDGTACEVLNGIMTSGKQQVAMLPWAYGTGCDFRRVLHSDDSVAHLVDLLNHTAPRPVDILQVDFRDSGRRSYALNLLNMGVGALTSQRLNNMKLKHLGKIGFIGAAFGAIAQFKPFAAQIIIDGKRVAEDIPAFNLIAVGNGQYFGGGMHVCPLADLHDGQAHVVLARKMSKLTMLTKFPKLIRGQHLDDATISSFSGRQIEIITEQPILVDTDGEHYDKATVRVGVLADAINLVF